MDKSNWIKLGEVGVDSGHLMICDPSYIDGFWKNGPYLDIRLYRDKETQKLFAYNTKEAKLHLTGFEVEFFDNFESILSTSKTPNASMVNWEQVQFKDESFSYNGVSHMEGERYKQIKFPLGFDGMAVAFRSGYGDGHYDVMGRLDDDGRIVEVRILMDCK